jgi:hypothetical protein
MAFFTRTMREISSFIGETDDEVTYGRIEKAILENIEGNNLFYPAGRDDTYSMPHYRLALE